MFNFCNLSISSGIARISLDTKSNSVKASNELIDIGKLVNRFSSTLNISNFVNVEILSGNCNNCFELWSVYLTLIIRYKNIIFIIAFFV